MGRCLCEPLRVPCLPCTLLTTGRPVPRISHSQSRSPCPSPPLLPHCASHVEFSLLPAAHLRSVLLSHPFPGHLWGAALTPLPSCSPSFSSEARLLCSRLQLLCIPSRALHHTGQQFHTPPLNRTFHRVPAPFCMQGSSSPFAVSPVRQTVGHMALT